MSAPRVFAYVGSMGNRENRGHGEGVTAFRFDPETGALAFVNQIEVDEPCTLAVAHDARTLYSTNEMAKFVDGLPGTGGGMTAMAINQIDGSIRLLNQTPSMGAIPAYMCLDTSGTYACAAIHGSLGALSHYERNENGVFECHKIFDRSGVSLFPLREDGSLGPGCDFLEFTTPGNADYCAAHPEEVERGFPGQPLLSRKILQMKVTVHCVDFDHRGYGVVCERGSDRMYLIRINRETNRLELLYEHKAPLGSAPRHVTFHPEKPFFYITNEMESTVSAFRLEEEQRFEAIQTVSTLAPGDDFKNSPADIRIHPSGKFLYASNRGDNSIAVYRVDLETGLLEQTEIFQLGEPSPRWFDIDPTGAILLVANSNADRVVSLRIHPETGSLSFTGYDARVMSPSCVRFAVLP